MVKTLFFKKIPAYYFVIILVLTISVTFFIASSFQKSKDLESQISNNSSSCSYSIKRLQGYDYIKPIMFVDNSCESENLSSIKQSVNGLIDNYKKSNTITSASVYLKSYDNNDWTSINPDEKFKPGSLLKIPELIAFLKMNEKNPGLLDKEILYSRPFSIDKKPEFVSKSIQLGHKYKIRELLDYMITYSDNNATLLLNSIIDVKVFKKVFTDIGLSAPDWNSSDFPLTSYEASLFMRTLFNASYLTIENSEFASKLLSKSDYKDGIIKSLPAGTKVIHKFGEAGDPIEKQLHETAIIYVNDNPYLVTIMTKGNNMDKLPEVISQISTLIYQNMNTNSKNM
ncbi:serine hydrolase [Flavobacterium sp. SUN052]|uniref:serine hydrolase n=1 Tax=Flavobacterium sp. SUN052 TaxID=3002441 RepID=UPI00237ECD5B|nr:serine hydrolase [Flavobacterium sp. SUN052]MEC4005047.1 serine hydrolase [Flavobacterium sp. SUN052]